MNIFLFIASIFIAALAFAHSLLGDKYILSKIADSKDLPQLLGSDDFTKRTLRFAWHLTTMAWWGISAILLCLAFDLSSAWIIRTIAVTFWFSGIIAFLGSQGRHMSWIVFFIITVMAWLGS